MMHGSGLVDVSQTIRGRRRVTFDKAVVEDWEYFARGECSRGGNGRDIGSEKFKSTVFYCCPLRSSRWLWQLNFKTTVPPNI